MGEAVACARGSGRKQVSHLSSGTTFQAQSRLGESRRLVVSANAGRIDRCGRAGRREPPSISKPSDVVQKFKHVA